MSMHTRLRTVLLGAAAMAMLPVSGAMAQVANLTFLYTDDNPANVERTRELTEQFNAENDDIVVEFISTGYDAVMRQLPMQLAVGEGPDLAKVTDNTLSRFGLDMRPYMEDPDGFAELYGGGLNLLRVGEPEGSDAIKGYIVNQTLNMPFVNVTLFDQAGVAIPEPGSTLAEIVAASVEVAEATGVAVPFTLDRSGHRFAGPLLSVGANLYNVEEGTFIFPDEAAQGLITELYEYTQTGAFPQEMWGAAGGSAYRSMGEEFANANVVTYLSGNWMVATFNDMIGDAFDWTAIQAPCGDAGCVAMPGGTAIIGFDHTDHPAELARFIEFLGSAEIQQELAEEFVLIPGANVTDLTYRTDNENVQRSMQVFLDNRDTVTDEARAMSIAPGNTAFYNIIVQRMSQLIVGELTLEQTFSTLANDIDDINAELLAQQQQ